MIRTIKELQEYLLEDAEKFEELRMTSPGCPPERIEELKKALPGIPESYTKWVERFNLNRICIGYFKVSPCADEGEDMVSTLIDGNTNKWILWGYAKRHHLYSIATIDGYAIYVATAASSFAEGEIIAIDIEAECADTEEEGDRLIYRVAQDFEQFLLIAGNLNQVKRELKDDSERREEFIKRLKALRTCLHN